MTSIAAAARKVLLTADLRDKVFLARRVARQWRQGGLAWRFDVAMPDEPALLRAELDLSPSPLAGEGGGAAAG